MDDMKKNLAHSELIDDKGHIYIYAHDISGSTSKVSYYFKQASKYLETFKIETRNKANVFYLIWDNQCKQTNLTEMEEIYHKQAGHGGTEPHDISNWIIKNNLQNKEITLWLITDGEIQEHSMVVCKSLNYGINFVQVTLVTINERQIDNSISFAFFNNNCKINVIEEVLNRYKKISLDTTSYDFDKMTVDNFMETFDELMNYVISKYTIDHNKLRIDMIAKANLEKDVLDFIQNLKKKRTQLLADIKPIEKMTINTESFKLSKNEIIALIKELSFYKEIFKMEKTMKNFIIEKVDSLISFIHNSNKSSFSFSELKNQIHHQQFDTRKAEELEDIHVAAVSLDELDDSVSFYDCFSLCESNSPIVCFSKINYIVNLIATDNQLFIHIQDFAFALINNENFLKDKEYVCQTYDSQNFQKYMEILNESEFTFPIKDPNTRVLLHGGIIPYAFANQWNDHSICNIFFNGKKVRKTFHDMIYFVIWCKLEKVERVEQSVVAQLKEYALYRIYNGESKLTFSSLPMEPKSIVPIPIALFYCVQLSTEMFSQHDVLFKNEKIRAFVSTFSYIIDILKYCKIDIDENLIRNRAEIFSELIKMKKLNPFEKVQYIANSIFKSEEGFLLSVIENPENIKKVRYLYEDLNAKVKYVNEKKLDLIKEKFKLYYLTNSTNDYSICPKTCRPYFRINGDTFYEKIIKKDLVELKIEGNEIVKKLVVDSKNIDYSMLLSICKMYIGFVIRNKRYPSIDEIKERLLKEKSIYTVDNIKINCLFPENHIEIVEQIINLYEPIKKTVAVKDFIVRAQNSISIAQKQEMEK